MSIAGMILGIIAMMFAWIPVIGYISIPLILVGLPLAFFGLRRSRKNRSGVGMAVTGLILHLLALTFIVYYTVTFLFFVEVTQSTST